MNINIPDKVIVSLILSQLPNDQWGALEPENTRKMRDLIAKQVMERIGEVEMPVISKEELKQAVLNRMVERALSKEDE